MDVNAEEIGSVMLTAAQAQAPEADPVVGQSKESPRVSP